MLHKKKKKKKMSIISLCVYLYIDRYLKHQHRLRATNRKYRVGWGRVAPLTGLRREYDTSREFINDYYVHVHVFMARMLSYDEWVQQYQFRISTFLTS